MITLEQLTTVLDDRFGSLNRKLDERFDAIDKRFEAIDVRFEAIDVRFDRIEEKVNGLESDIDTLARITAQGFTDMHSESTKVHGRIDSLEERTTALEQTA